jgi:import inner membrane translocase subunit TIM16
MQMSLDEAHLILNANKEDPMEIIERVRPSRPYAIFKVGGGNTDFQNFETIFKANGPPAEPTAPAKPVASGSKQTPTTRESRKSKQPQYSHYLQSKVYRALERIKAERESGAPPPPTAGEGGVGGEGAAAAAPGTGTGAPGGTST